MNAEKREKIRQTLRSLAEAHASEMKLMEQMSALLHEELALDAATFWKTRGPALGSTRSDHPLQIDRDRLTVSFRDKSCFLGNTLPFRLVDYLARHLNTYLTYTDLLENVWECRCTDSAIRSVVKRLRSSLRQSGMDDLANAVDGSVPGRYALRLDSDK